MKPRPAKMYPINLSICNRKLTNLEATRDRIKSFLDEAKTVDEALRINAELANVEAQIEQIKGQMNYLEDRSAFSTITINFEPVLPEQLTPTPTPSPTPNAWNPGDTFKNAKKTVTFAYQGIIDLLIWVLVVLVPIFAPFVLIVWALVEILHTQTKKTFTISLVKKKSRATYKIGRPVLHYLYSDPPQIHGLIKSSNFALKSSQRIGRGILLEKFDHFRVVADRLGENHFAAHRKVWQT